MDTDIINHLLIKCSALDRYRRKWRSVGQYEKYL